MKAYHYLLIAIVAVCGIPSMAINLGWIRNMFLYLGATGISFVILAAIAFKSFFAFLEEWDYEEHPGMH